MKMPGMFDRNEMNGNMNGMGKDKGREEMAGVDS